LEPLISQKVKKVAEYLDAFRKHELTESHLNKVLQTQELVRELTLNA